MIEQSSINMPDVKHLVVSSSPHYHTGETVQKVMMWVIIALLPGCAAGIYYFGLTALRVLAVCTIGCVAFEAIFAKLMKRPLEINDLSAVVTGLLLGMNMPPEAPTWVCLLGSLIAMGVGKMIYGGIGCNPFNPALVARVALLVAMPAVMSTWTAARHGIAALTVATPVAGVASATPLASLDVAHKAAIAGDMNAIQNLLDSVPTLELFLGNHGGCIGETCVPALLIGGILLVCLNIIRWQIPVCYLLTVAIITGIARLISPELCVPPLFHLLSGGLMLGAIFMATDMVTTPLSRKGAVVFAVGCGIITSSIRLWGSYPEGVSFSILIMNALTPLIDRFTAGKPFGTPRGGVVNVNKR